MSTVKKPILLDETGKEIVTHMRTQNALLAAIARESIGALTSWKDIQAIVRQGLAPEIFHIGDQFIVPWKDVATDQSYDVPLDVVHFDNVELKGGDVVPAMFLQWHYALPFAIQFDAPENGIMSGTFSRDYSYYVANSGGYKLLTPGIDYTIGDIIPTAPVHYCTEIKDATGNVCRYGYNRWSHSAVRQFLNSKADKGAWWVPQHFGDTRPDQLSTNAGFMTGFEEDFLSCLSPIKVTTALNTVTDGRLGTTENTYDTFFLPSFEQMYAEPQLAGVEGKYFEYWKRATGSAKPNASGDVGKNSGYITYPINNKTSPQLVRLRSAARSTSCNTGYVSTTGMIGTYSVNHSRWCAPVCAIC